MNKTQFLHLSSEAIAANIKVCNLVAAAPINGTRRWFMLEHMPAPEGVDMMTHYMEMAGNEHVRIFKLFFDHGIHTLLSPTFGLDIMGRDEAYTQMALAGMRHLVEDRKFLDFYEQYEVRVRFYGEYRKYFAGTPFEPFCDMFDELTEQTLHHSKNRLFWGVCAHDNVQPIADLSVAFYQTHGRIPNREELIQDYYGETLSPINLFVGFDRFTSYDMPLLTTGEEDLYFTIAPTLYMTETQLREIIYDHLYARPETATDYGDVEDNGWHKMRTFYQSNMGRTQGIGKRQVQGDYWYPTPQVILPEGFEER